MRRAAATAIQLSPVLAVGTLAGLGLSQIGTPLPWMMGPLFVAAAAAALTPLAAPPDALRRAGQLLVASAVALNLSPAALSAMGSDFAYMLGAALASIAGAVALARLLAQRGVLDANTGLLSLLPGGPAEMATLAVRHGGRSELVVLSQTLRLGLTVVLLPLFLLALAPSPTAPGAEASGSPLSSAFVLGAALAASAGLHRLGISNAFFVGPLAVIGAAALAGLPDGPLPAWLVVIGQVFIGTALGYMLNPRRLAGLGRDLQIAAAVSVYLLVFGLGIALALAALGASGFGELALASSAGGVAEMAIAAKGFGFDPAYVAAYHLIRIFLIFAIIGWLIRIVR